MINSGMFIISGSGTSAFGRLLPVILAISTTLERLLLVRAVIQERRRRNLQLNDR